MAILDLIAQADETTEVAGLSASVTELQIEVAGLSASIAGLTGGGSSYTYIDENTTDKTFLISITGSTIYDEILLDPDQTIGNTRIKSVDTTDSGNYSQFVSTYDNPSWDILTSIGSSGNITLSAGSIDLSTTDGTNTVSMNMDNTTGTNTSTVTDGTSTSTQTITSTQIENKVGDFTVDTSYNQIGQQFNYTALYNSTSTYDEVFIDVNGNNGIDNYYININQNSLTGDVQNNIFLGNNVTTDKITIKSEVVSTGEISSVIVNPDELKLSVTDGLTTTSISIGTVSIQLDNIPSYDDDSAAGTGGLTPGMVYQTTGLGANPLDVAGILMIKQ
jgi:hypothetical protein